MPKNSESTSGAESFGIGIIGALVAAIVVAVLLEGKEPAKLAGQLQSNVKDVVGMEQQATSPASQDATRKLQAQAEELTSVQSFEDLQAKEREIQSRANTTVGAGAPAGPSFNFGSEVRTQARQQTSNNPSPTRTSDDDLQPLSSISDEPVTTTAAGDPLSDRDFARAARESL